MQTAWKGLMAMKVIATGRRRLSGRNFMSNTNYWVAMTLMVMLGLVALPALSAEPGTTNTPSMTDRTTSVCTFVQSNKVIGARVQNNSGDKLGTIDDIVLTADRHMVLYAVLSHGGAMGIHEKYFAVSWSALTVQAKEPGKIDYLVLDIPKDTLSNSQGFDHKNWPVSADTTLFKVPMAHEERETGTLTSISRYQKVSELSGLTVQNTQKESLGDIECLMIDQRKGKVNFALVGYGGVMGVREKLSPVPWKSIEIQPEQKIAMLQADKNKLTSLSFLMKDYPNFSDRQYTDRIFRTYNIEPPAHVAAEPKEAMSFDAWKADSDYNKKYDVSKLTTSEGTVQSLGTFHIEANSAPGLLIELKTEKGDVMVVHAGPSAFAQSKSFTLATGDKISVSGTQIEFDSKTILMAGEVKRGNDTLTLRDSSGKVQWDVNELQKIGTESSK
jgi:sporulation protein YlmC with PRC-barrel domain